MKKQLAMAFFVLVLTACQTVPTPTASPVPTALPPSPIADARTISLATLEWPPYAGEKLSAYGFTSEIVKEAFTRAGYDVKVTFLPWARVLEEVEAGKYDAGYPGYYSEERAQTYLLSESFAEGPLGFYKRKGEAIAYTKLEDLKPYHIGIVRGYVNTPAFDAADYLQKDVTDSDEINLRKLQAKRVDLIVIDKFTALYLLTTAFPEGQGAFEFLEPPLETKPLYVMFSRQAAGSLQKLQDFNAGLKKIQDDGTLERILVKYGLNK